MRPKSQWTPGSVVLWLIAAITATLAVCSELPEPRTDVLPAEVEVELEVNAPK